MSDFKPPRSNGPNKVGHIIGAAGREGVLMAAATGTLTMQEQKKVRVMEEQRQMRVHQYEVDRAEMLLALDPVLHRKFVLRWGLPHPEDWDDVVTIMLGIHANRLMLPDFTNAEKLKSARFFEANNQPLPAGIKLVGDLMTGTIVSALIVE